MLTKVRTPVREFRTMTMDSHRWDGFSPRPDDIIIATYPKCGTTWTQRIVDLLVFQTPAPREFLAASPWLDATFFAPIEEDLEKLEAQTHRRFIKTHLPFDAMPVFDGTKVIHVARDGRDACISMHNHMLGIRPETFAMAATSLIAQGLAPPAPRGPTPENPRDFFLDWMDRAEAGEDGGALTDLPFCEFEQTYWRERRQPWMLHVHYNDLKADLAGEMRRIADFLDIEVGQGQLDELAAAASFETMKAQGEVMMPQLRNNFDHGAQRFINKGFNGRWKDVLTAQDLSRYDALVGRMLSAPLAAWIENGRAVAGDPRTLAD